MTGTLYLVATPVGDYDDLTLRALRVLKEADLVVCEEFTEGRKLLRHFGVEKFLDSLNEHNEEEKSAELLEQLKEGKRIALISDCGTPVFTDPGKILVRRAIEAGIPTFPIPGPSSIIPALVASGFPTDSFLFPGWLSPKRAERRRELEALRDEKRTTILMDAPYRLSSLLSDLVEVLGGEREVCVAMDLTMQSEEYVRGPASSVLERIGRQKREFVIVLRGRQQG